MGTHGYSYSSSSQRPLAMMLALVSAVVLSPLYGNNSKSDRKYYESKFNSGLVLPMLLAGLIIAIRTTSQRPSFLPSPHPSWILRIGTTSSGLAGILLMLMLVLYWQASLQNFFWR
ncbi:hypothetical protein Fmac_010877 [Flemingia macrophylla]|uniref:NADH dehydrogenase subunit 5 n=1 Tax=Flemingia macrophylla TaxID=520843 RepID=A0ABD1MKU6_9FABA